MRKVPGFGVGWHGRHIGRVTEADALAATWQPGVTFFIRSGSKDLVSWCDERREAGLTNIFPIVSDARFLKQNNSGVIDQFSLLQVGDVVSASSDSRFLQVLYRETDLHHTIFITNRCNSLCIMCSQPPTPQDDSWLIDEGRLIARHIRNPPAVFGFTGGEPLLAGRRLRQLLDEFLSIHRNSYLEVLTNGRLFSDHRLAAELVDGLEPRVSWMVPLYGHADFLHDFVVQTPGAFDETIDGLLELRSRNQRVQLRVVLIRPVLEHLSAIAEFICRNLCFVEDVALMACEPTGFARANRELTKIDYIEWQSEIAAAVKIFADMNIKVVLMNLPRCLLSKELWTYAAKSISDWKNVYAEECSFCVEKPNCCGLFASTAGGWLPGRLDPILKGGSSE